MRSVLEALKQELTRRRALLITPFAFAGLVAISSRKESDSEDRESVNDSNSEVVIVPFTDMGERLAPVTEKKLVRPDGQWRKLLNAEQFYVTRDKVRTQHSRAPIIRCTTAVCSGASAAAMHCSAPMPSSIPAPVGRVSPPRLRKRTFLLTKI
jgi:hypothetical protein